MSDDVRDLMLVRRIAAPREAVWRCWTEPKLLEQWFCPAPWRASDARIDLRPGGAFACVMNGPNGEKFENLGVVLEAAPNERLVTTDAFLPDWTPSGRAFMAIHMTLEPIGDETRYEARVRHWTEEAKAEHERMGFHQGWSMAADQLEALAKTL